MNYKFKCNECGNTEVVSIKVDDYDKEKDLQKCSNCGSKLERVIEWDGPATNLGGYSDVGGKASWQ